MILGKYQFNCRFESEAVLPYYKGSTFRGVFGKALKRVVCALRRESCENCILNGRCVYSFVFETELYLKDIKDTRIVSPPHPFVIEPPKTHDIHFTKNNPFDFHLLLFGNANDCLPYFVYAFEQMGKIGVGKRINGKRGTFILEEVKRDNEVIYSVNDQKLNMGRAFKEITMHDKSDFPEGEFRLRLFIETPLRLKFKNRLHAELPFHVLTRAMLRRISSLFNCYNVGEPGLDYRGLVKRAEKIGSAESDLTWFDWKRYSSRQDKEMLMGGMLGSITYEGEIGEYMALVDFCSQVHLGKQTSFGLGKIKAEIEQ